MLTQRGLYNKMKYYNLTSNCVQGCDYFMVGFIDNITYYAPNDEDASCIIAIDHENKLASDTGFDDMDDMEITDSDYAITNHNGQLMYKYKVPK